MQHIVIPLNPFNVGYNPVSKYLLNEWAVRNPFWWAHWTTFHFNHDWFILVWVILSDISFWFRKNYLLVYKKNSCHGDSGFYQQSVWTYSLTHSLTHSTHSLTLTFSLSHSLFLSHSLTHSITLLFSLSLTHSLSLSHSLSLTHSLTITHSLSLTLSHYHSLFHSLFHSHSLTHSLTLFACYFVCFSPNAL